MTTLNREYLEKLYGKESLKNVAIIQLEQKNINNIDPNTFKDLLNLKTLELSHNKFKTIESGTFKNLTNLTLLDLSDNKIENINEDLFEDLSSIKQLSLYRNSIKQIDSDTFYGLEKLEELELNDNKLEKISGNGFESLKNLKLLKLDKNQLKELNRKCFAPLKSIELIILYDNQFSYKSYISPTNTYKNRHYDSDKLKKNGFLSDWNIFLSQFPDLKLEIYESDEKDRKILELQKEKEELELRNKQLEEEVRVLREENERIKAENIAQQPNLENEIDGFLKLINLREVKSSTILSAWIIDNQFKNDLKGQVIDERYEIDTFKGKGTYGNVYTIFDQNEQNKIKIIKMLQIAETDWKKEAMLLSRLNHKNIVKFEDVFVLLSKESLSYPCILTEYCENGDLAAKIIEKKNKKEKFDEKTILNWIYEAADGVRYLHSLFVIHRDIKPQNILLTKDNVLKLADLGCAKVLQDTLHANTYAGTMTYMSQELIDQNYSFPTDIWSLGCVLYELVFLESAHTNFERKKKNLSGVFSPFIKKMLVQDPKDRINAQMLFKELKELIQIRLTQVD